MSGTQTEWNVLDEVNTTQAIDLAVAVVMVSLKFGRRTYISSQGSVLGVNEVKERLARHGRKMSKGRTKSLMVKTFADFGEVHEAGVVVGGKEGVLVKFMGALLAAGFDEEEAKGVLKGDSGWIDVEREAGEGEEIALRILREEGLDVKDYYEFENQEEKIDVIVKFQRVWNVINGRKEVRSCELHYHCYFNLTRHFARCRRSSGRSRGRVSWEPQRCAGPVSTGRWTSSRTLWSRLRRRA